MTGLKTSGKKRTPSKKKTQLTPGKVRKFSELLKSSANIKSSINSKISSGKKSKAKPKTKIKTKIKTRTKAASKIKAKLTKPNKNSATEVSVVQFKPESGLSDVDEISVVMAREHNLKGVSVKIPRDKITVITGLSGSGKSSLAFDTIYAEGQRRYLDGLSAYARSFVTALKKPDVDRIQGLSPTIAIDQKSISSNPRSTVGTVTEVYDYVRLIYAKLGTPKCPTHRIPVSRMDPGDIYRQIISGKSGSKFFLLAPMFRGKKGEFQKEIATWIKQGYLRAKIDNQWVELQTVGRLAKTKAHDIDLVIDRLVVDPKYELRLKEGINQALNMAKGLVAFQFLRQKESILFSIHSSCEKCGYSFPKLEPQSFSFNNPKGQCGSCSGLGRITVEEAGVKVVKRRGRPASKQNPKKADSEELVLNGIAKTCPKCKGHRLNDRAMNVEIADKNISEVTQMSIEDTRSFFNQVKWSKRDQMIAEKIVAQIDSRLNYMMQVGTGYLSLSRATQSLSGGEAQRVRLATQVGSGLLGVLYVLDEPSIGLHPRDHQKLLKVLMDIRDRGNTILMVEHDEETIRGADHIIDLGPGAGVLGGELVAEGTPAAVSLQTERSWTAKYLSGELSIGLPKSRRPGSGQFLEILGATGNNLAKVNLKIPLGTFTGITGISGSGKSTLIVDTLYPILAGTINGLQATPSPYEKAIGLEHIDKVIEIDQRPIGRTPRSIPATYVGIFGLIRETFAQLPEAKLRGWGPGHFSFNVKGGRCETCLGGGQVKVEMHFLADVYVTCEDCLGQRYRPELLKVKYRDQSIYDVLAMSVAEAALFFKAHLNIYAKLRTLQRVGLDYITLGQSSTILSGGEAQRIKLSKELSKRSTGKTLYILDEPTTGLHFEDVRKLIDLLQELTDQGNTLVVIEHNMDVIKCCDYIIDLGPEGGKNGGRIVSEGPPEKLIKTSTHTAKVLAAYL